MIYICDCLPTCPNDVGFSTIAMQPVVLSQSSIDIAIPLQTLQPVALDHSPNFIIGQIENICT